MKWNLLTKASVGAALILCVLALMAVFFGLFNQANATGPLASDEHLITIHDRGREHSIISKKDTLREVFADAHIVLDQNDIVEPGLDEKLVSQSYQVNIYRARPVTIVDGDHRIRIMSAYQTPEQIATQAGITLHDEDEETLELPKNLVASGSSLQLIIHRATPMWLVLYGKKERVYTQATTVAEFLKEKNVTLAAKDDMNLPQSAAIHAGIKLEIWRNGVQTRTREEKIAFSVRQVQDADHPVGYKKIETRGVAGKKVVTYKLTIKNGKVVKKKAIHSVVLKKAVQQVEIVGTKVELPAGSHEDWMDQAGMSSGNFGYINYIFTHESGWNPAARNPAGYVGLGQTSESNLSGACPSWESDPICQIKFFNGYANGRYGSWKAAYDFKASNGWW